MAMQGLKSEPIRGMDDFLLDRERYGLPNFKDVDKWAKRVKQNLMYYQTNYLFFYGMVFCAMIFMRPGGVGVAYGCVGGMMAALAHQCRTKPMLGRVRRDQPLLCVVFAFLVAFLLNLIIIGDGRVFAFSILLPIFAIIAHASLRLRNTKNKLTNLKLLVGQETIMSRILDILEMKFEGFTDA